MVVTNEDVDLYLDNHLNNLIAQHGSKEAIETDKTIKEVVLSKGLMSEKELGEALDISKLV